MKSALLHLSQPTQQQQNLSTGFFCIDVTAHDVHGFTKNSVQRSTFFHGFAIQSNFLYYFIPQFDVTAR
jgi:hypothetical protein